MTAMVLLTAGCADLATDEASGPSPSISPTSTSTPSQLQLTANSGLWTPAQACDAIKHDDAKDLAMLLSFMEAQPPDLDHLVAAYAVAEDFHELGSGTEGPLGDHLVALASEVHALIAKLWEAGDDWVVADETFDLSPFEEAVVGLGEECPTPPAP